MTPFLSLQRACSREHKVFDDGSGIRGRSPVLLWGAASLSISAPELRSWHRYPTSPCCLWSVVWSRFSLLVAFLGVFSIIARPALGNCLLRSHHHDMIGDVIISTPTFSFGRTHACKTKTCIYITFVRCIRICKRRDVI